jgi:HSP20 family protein
MAIVKWTPFTDFFGDDFFGDMPVVQNSHFVPAMDVYEEKDNVVVETPLTGIDPKNVNVEIEDNILKISGTTERKTEVDEKNYYRREIRTGHFYRTVALPKAVDAGKANAAYENGLLRITVPKKEEAKPKAITVNIK